MLVAMKKVMMTIAAIMIVLTMTIMIVVIAIVMSMKVARMISAMTIIMAGSHFRKWIIHIIISSSNPMRLRILGLMTGFFLPLYHPTKQLNDLTNHARH